MAVKQNIFLSGAWHPISNQWIFLSGAWHQVTNGWIFLSGAWHPYYTSLFVLTYAANGFNRNIFNDAVANGWNQTSALTVNINSGILLYSTNTGIPALDTGAIGASIPLIINHSGFIRGAGGAGGAGSNSSGGGGDRDHPANGTVGAAGGTAFKISSACAITMNVAGIIAGGGGGGGGGGNAVQLFGSAGYHTVEGGAGGAGYGPNGAYGGAPGGYVGGYSGPYGGYGPATGGSGGAGGGAGYAGASGASGTGGSYGGGIPTGAADGAGAGGNSPGKAIDLAGHAMPTITGNDGPHGTHIKGVIS